MKSLLCSISIAMLYCLMSCSNTDKKEMSKNLTIVDSNTTDEAIRNNKLVIYQIMMRLYGNKNTTNKFYGSIEENGCGKFNDIDTRNLEELKKMGVNYVWYTGVLEHATMTDYSEFGIYKDDADVVKGRAGSPYAIKDYYDVNPDLAQNVTERIKEFEALIKRTHESKLKLLIDFIPNHVARKYVSDAKPSGVKDLGADDNISDAFNPNNNFYYLPGKSFVVPGDVKKINELPAGMQNGKFDESPAKVTGNDVFNEAPSVNDWYETIKLNYGIDIQNNRSIHFEPIPATWKKMTDILLYWAAKNVDGFRCDMAEMVPVEFWNYAINTVKEKYPDVIFVAEIYNPKEYKNYIEKGRFDYLYDKVGTYDAIRRLTTGSGHVNDLTHGWKTETRGISNNLVRFMENHDEQRIASDFFAGNPMRAIPGMVASATMGSGPVLIYFGQEVGEKGLGAEGFGGEDGRTTIFDYWGVPAHQAWMNDGKLDGGKLNDAQKVLRSFYVKLLNLCNSNEAINAGNFYELQQAQYANAAYNDSLMFSYLRYSADEKILVVCNFNTSSGFTGVIQIPEVIRKSLHINDENEAMDLLTDTKFKITENGIAIEVPEMSAVIIRIY